MTSAGSRRRKAIAVVASMAAVAAAACSQPVGTLDRAATERAVEKVIGGRLDDVERIRCPDEIARGAGKQFRCDAVLEGDSLEVRLRVRQVDADASLEVQLLDAAIDRTEVAEDLRRSLVTAFERAFTVDCGEGVTVSAPGSTFSCTAEDPDGTRQVAVTVTDPAGTLSYDVGT